MKSQTLIVAAVLTLAAPAWAEEGHAHMDHAAMGQQMAPAGAMKSMAITAEAKVNAIDLDLNVANLSHGPIAALRWPPMTMDLALRDAEVVKGIQPGDRVRFELEQTGPTDYVIVKMEKL